MRKFLLFGSEILIYKFYYLVYIVYYLVVFWLKTENPISLASKAWLNEWILRLVIICGKENGFFLD